MALGRTSSSANGPPPAVVLSSRTGTLDLFPAFDRAGAHVDKLAASWLAAPGYPPRVDEDDEDATQALPQTGPWAVLAGAAALVAMLFTVATYAFSDSPPPAQVDAVPLAAPRPQRSVSTPVVTEPAAMPVHRKTTHRHHH